MKSKPTAGLYVLLIVIATVSMGYYIAGAVALREEFFHAGRYARTPFDIRDYGQTLTNVRKEAAAAGLSNGDFLLAINGVPFTGEAQLHDIRMHFNPGQAIGVSVRTPAGQVREVQVRLASRQGPHWSLGRDITYLTPIIGVPLLGLLIGYWVVAARPRDLNAWLVLVLLAFPETAFGDLDLSFWPEPWYLLPGLWNSIVQILVFPALLWFGFLSRALESGSSATLVQVRHPGGQLRCFCFRTSLLRGTTLFRSIHPLPFAPANLDPSRLLLAERDLSSPFPRCSFRQIALRVHGRCTTAHAGIGHRKWLVDRPPDHHLQRGALVRDGSASWKLVFRGRPGAVDLSTYPGLCSDRSTGHGCPHPAAHGHEIFAGPRHRSDG